MIDGVPRVLGATMPGLFVGQISPAIVLQRFGRRCAL